MSEQKKKNNKRKLLIALYLLAVVALGTVIYILPKVSDALTRTWVLEYGDIQITDNVSGYLVREEQVMKAGGSGGIQYFIAEGEMVRKGTQIMSIGGNAGSYTAGTNGIVSYYSDGLEDYFGSETVMDLNKKETEEQEVSVADTTRTAAVSGEFACKLVDADEWFLTYWVGEKSIAKYTKGNSVTLELPLGRVKGRISEIQDEGDGHYQILLRCTRHYEDLCKARKTTAVVVLSDTVGLLVRNASITAEDGQPGVYVKDLNGNYSFTPVSVLATDGEYSILAGGTFTRQTEDGSETVNTVEAYDEILNNPKE